MAVAFDAASSGQTTNATSITVAHTCSGSDRVLFVGVGWSTGPEAMASVTGVTYNGVALTQIWEIIDSPTDHANAGWYLIAPATGTNNIVVTFASAMDEICAGGISFTGAHQTSPLGTFQTANGTTGNATVNVSSAADEIVVDNCYVGQNGITVGAGQTQRWQQANIGSYSTGGGSTETGAATTTMSWTITSGNPWNIGAVPIKPAGAAASGTKKLIGGKLTNGGILNSGALA